MSWLFCGFLFCFCCWFFAFFFFFNWAYQNRFEKSAKKAAGEIQLKLDKKRIL